MNQIFPEAIVIGGAIEMLAGTILVAATYINNEPIQNFMVRLPMGIVGTIIIITGSRLIALGLEGYSLKKMYLDSQVDNTSSRR